MITQAPRSGPETSSNGGARLGEIFLSLLAFALGLAFSWYHGFQTRDLVWGLWISSLIVGYLTILVGLPCYVLLPPSNPKAVAERAALQGLVGKESTPDAPASPAAGKKKHTPMTWFVLLFTIGLTTFHFCSFHSGHAEILNHFFPLDAEVDPDFIKAFTSPPLLWKKTAQYVLPAYGAFVLPALIAERGAFLTAAHPLLSRYRAFDRLKIEAPKSDQSYMVMPYRNVMKMQLTIFGLAMASHFSFDSVPIYALIYALYFFPWGRFRQSQKAEPEK